jgi:hypothetical protein
MTVSARSNPYLLPLKGIFSRVTLLNGLFFQLTTHLEHRAKQIEESLHTHSIRRRSLFSGSTLVLRDLTEWPQDKWARYYPAGTHARSGRHIVKCMREIIHLNAAWTVSQSFEAFETFAKDIAALYLKRNPSALGNNIWIAKRRKNAPSQPTGKSIAAYKIFIRETYRGTEDLMARLRSSWSGLRLSEQRNNRSVDLSAWLKVVSEVRHATVHTGAVILPKKHNVLGTNGGAILLLEFPGKLGPKGYKLMLTEHSSDNTLQRFAEYAFLVFKEASLNESLNWQVLGSKKLVRV